MQKISVKDYKTTLSLLPNLPGVYRYFDEKGQCLYVGKARDLNHRVSSYFHKNDLSPRIAIMVSHIAAIETTVVRSEAEALILENNLIKTLNPKYNILFRDDKSYPYVKISAGPFPRVSYYRGALDKKSRFFGPYPNASAAREAIVMLQRVFRIRTCEDAVFKNRSRACLMGQMGRCSAPCVGAITETDYEADVSDACRFLSGESGVLVQGLKTQMYAASERFDYEKAAVLRDRIAALTDAVRDQVVEPTGVVKDTDIIAVALSSSVVCVNLAMVRNGRHLGDHAFFPKIADASDLTKADVFEAFVSQHYEEQMLPSVVVSSDALDSTALIRSLGNGLAGKTQLVREPQQIRRKWLEMAERGAKIALEARLTEIGGEKRRIDDLIRVLNLPLTPEEIDDIRIECFDISHTAGEATQASCVVFHGRAMDSSRYRRFNITDVTAGDDYAAMREVLMRRYTPVARGEAKLPTLVLVDGGLGQVHMARDVFIELGLPMDVIVGVAKGEGRKVGLETLIFADGREPLTLGAESPALMLIAMIRDEAHRFAITGMRAKRSRARLTSRAEDLEGVGPKRRQKLLAQFGGFRGLTNASVEDIAKIDGISRKLATRIYAQLHGVDNGIAGS